MDHYEKYYVPPGKTRENCKSEECYMLPEYQEKEYDIISYLQAILQLYQKVNPDKDWHSRTDKVKDYKKRLECPFGEEYTCWYDVVTTFYKQGTKCTTDKEVI